MRRERLYLLDIIKAVDNIASMIAATDRDSFIADIILRQAVVYSLMTIGEATAHISRLVRERHPAVSWRDMIGLRSIEVAKPARHQGGKPWSRTRQCNCGTSTKLS